MEKFAVPGTVPCGDSCTFGAVKPMSVRSTANMASILRPEYAEIAIGTSCTASAADFFCAVTSTSSSRALLARRCAGAPESPGCAVAAAAITALITADAITLCLGYPRGKRWLERAYFFMIVTSLL